MLLKLSIFTLLVMSRVELISFTFLLSNEIVYILTEFLIKIK